MHIEVQIPSHLSEITLDQYRRYMKVLQDNPEGDNRERFVTLKALEIFCNVPYKTAMQLKVIDVNRAVDKISKLLNSQPDLVQTMTMGDTEFGFIPKLDDMSFGEFIDLDNSIGNWDKMHEAMSVLYRPINKKIGKLYTIQDYKGDTWHDVMKHTPMDAVLGSILFFYHLGIDLSKLMTNYIQDQEVVQITDYSQVLEESGVGINQFTLSLREMLDDLKISQE